MKRAFIAFALLTLLYLLVVGHYSAWDWLAGAVLASALLAFFRGFLFGGGAPTPVSGFLLRLAAFFPLVVALVVHIIRGTWSVGLVILNVRPVPRSGIVEVPVGEMTPTGVSVTALIHGLSPGLIFLDVDWDRGVMIFHSLDAEDPEKVRQQIQRFYQRHQRAVFP